MDEATAATAPANNLGALDGWTILHIGLIALLAIAAILVIWWGSRLRAERRHADRELRERGEVIADPAPAQPIRDVPVAPSPPPLADQVAPYSTPIADEAEPYTAPIADEAEPYTAPIADEPIAAAAPLEASPATIAADAGSPDISAAPEADRLTDMKGVGPKVAAKLNELGFTRFSQLAALSDDEATALDARLGTFQGRLTRDRWIEQARFLAAGDRAGYEQVFGKL